MTPNRCSIVFFEACPGVREPRGELLHHVGHQTVCPLDAIARIVDKGRLRPLMEAVPVHVVTNEKAGLLGAARCAAVRGSEMIAV